MPVFMLVLADGRQPCPAAREPLSTVIIFS
jgi:hypothetical protein